MSDFVADVHTFSAGNTAEKVLDATDNDRHVRLYTTTSQPTIGFTAAQCAGFTVVNGSYFDFVLPAGEELWAIAPSSGNALQYMATGVRA